MTTATNPFITANWRPEHCDPENWKYKPSTYGVDGVEIVGDPHMMLFRDMTGIWTNPGRVERVNQGKLNDLKDNIIEFGINMEQGRMIYVDDKDSSTINGNHRKELGVDKKLGINGWMVQRVRFETETAKILFANVSNVEMKLPHNNPSPKDVEAAVRDLINLLKNPSRSDVELYVKTCGPHLGNKSRGKIIKNIMLELVLGGNVSSSERYTTYGKDTIDNYTENYCDDEWMENYLNNDNERVHVVTMYNFDSDFWSFYKNNTDARTRDEPLHLLIAVKEPSKNESLATKRDKVFNTKLKNVEDTLLASFSMAEKEINRYHFAWNHPDCEHRFLPQDNATEMQGGLIKIKNRTFN